MAVKRPHSPSGIPSRPSEPREPRGWIEEQLREAIKRQAEIDALVQPIIEARLRTFLPPAEAAAKGDPFEMHNDDSAPPANEQDRRDRKAERTARRVVIRQLLHRTLTRIVELVPSVTRKDLVAYVNESLPVAGRHRPRMPFDPALVEQAHAAILKARPDLGCREACQEIATRLRVSRRTIEDLRSRNK